MKCLECGTESKAKYCSPKCRENFLSRNYKSRSQRLRKYIFKELPNICQICHYVPPKGLEIILEFHHITENSGCLLCPNCHREVTILNKRGIEWKEILSQKKISRVDTIEDILGTIELRKNSRRIGPLRKINYKAKKYTILDLLNKGVDVNKIMLNTNSSRYYISQVARENKILIPRMNKRKREIRKCIRCGKEFEVTPSSKQKYCSSKCVSGVRGRRSKYDKNLIIALYKEGIQPVQIAERFKESGLTFQNVYHILNRSGTREPRFKHVKLISKIP
jgi:hypothetical protein